MNTLEETTAQAYPVYRSPIVTPFFIVVFCALVGFAVLPGPSKANPKAIAQVPAMTATERATIAPTQTAAPTNTTAPTSTHTQAPTNTAAPTERAEIIAMPTSTERATIAPTATRNLEFALTEAAVELQIRNFDREAAYADLSLLIRQFAVILGFVLAMIILLAFGMGNITAHIRVWISLFRASQDAKKVEKSAEEPAKPTRPTFSQALEMERITQAQFNSWLDIVMKSPTFECKAADKFHIDHPGIFRTQDQARSFYRLLKAYEIVEHTGQKIYLASDFRSSPTA